VDEIPVDPYKFDGPSRKAFMRMLGQTGRIADACQVAGVSTSYIYQRRKIDEALAAEMEEAMDVFRASIEAEIHRRAISGVDEKRFHQGSPVMDYELDEDGEPIMGEDGKPLMKHAYIRRYSDSLLLAYARRHIPEYNEKKQLDMKVQGLEQLLDEIRPSTGLPSESDSFEHPGSTAKH